jgi:hypothetical protein
MWNQYFRSVRIAAHPGSRIVVATILFAVLTTGCTPPPSTNYNTQALQLQASVEASGDGKTVVTAALFETDGLRKQVELVNGDGFQVSAYGNTLPLYNRGSNYVPKYQGNLDSDVGGEIRVAFTRTSPEVSAPDSLVILPEPFQVTGPQAGSHFSPTDTLTINWTPGGISTVVSIGGNCQGSVNSTPAVTRNISQQVTLDGTTYSLPITQLLGSAPLATGETCRFTITLTRSSTGQTDPNLMAGSSIVASQIRRITNLLIP